MASASAGGSPDATASMQPVFVHVPGQIKPQAPQFEGSVHSDASHPFAATRSQSANPYTHLDPQFPAPLLSFPKQTASVCGRPVPKQVLQPSPTPQAQVVSPSSRMQLPRQN